MNPGALQARLFYILINVLPPLHSKVAVALVEITRKYIFCAAAAPVVNTISLKCFFENDKWAVFVALSDTS